MAKFIYTDEHVEFVKSICDGKSIKELAEAFNNKYGNGMDKNKMKCFLYNKGIRSGASKGVKGPRIYNQEMIEFIEMNVNGTSYADLTRLVNDKFETNFTIQQIRTCLKNRKLKTGRGGHFKKGNVPHNKGIKIWWKGGELTRFKKGDMPPNHRPAGSERINVDGYVETKVSEPNRWRPKHTAIWEEHNGPLPPGHAVIFGDGNKRNFNINNLILVSRRQLLTLNKHKLIKNDADLTRTALIIADIKHKISQRK